MKQQVEGERVIQSLHQELDRNKKENEGLVAAVNQSTVRIEQLERELGNRGLELSQDSFRKSNIGQDQHLKSENMNMKLRLDEIYK